MLYPDWIALVYKIFIVDTLIYQKIEDKDISAVQFRKDLKVISNWVFQWKILFNPDPNKQTIEVYFSRKTWQTELLIIDF